MRSNIKQNEVCVVIPAYNERGVLESTIKSLNEHGFKKVVVVDDGSKIFQFDKKNFPDVVVIIHQINRGQGAALQTGHIFAQKRKFEYLVDFDADGQHDAADILPALELLKKEDLDVVLGSRFLKKDNSIPFKKQIILKMGIVFTWFVSGIKLTDTHNGFRVINTRCLDDINITLDRFEHASEILDKIHTNKLKYKEIPVNINYTEYSQAKGQKISNSIAILIKITLRKINDIFTL